MPARGAFRAAGDGKQPPRHGLVVQAEMQPDGAIVYGVIERHAIRRAGADEFAEVIPLKKVKAGGN